MSLEPMIEAVFDAYPAELRAEMLRLRETILETAANTDGVGPLEETLKWGQVSYLTKQSGSGTTVRIDRDKGTGRAAVFVNCQTSLLSQYRTLYPDSFDYDGARAVVMGEKPDLAALRHIIALALTYHTRKKASHVDN